MTVFGSYRAVAAVLLCVAAAPVMAGGLSLSEAVRLAVENHPRVAEAAAERRIADTRLRQQTGRYLPTLDVSGFLGEQFVDRPNSLAAAANANWQSNKQFDSTAQLVLFDGFDRANAVYGQIARINASAIRVLEQSELVALETVEAYLDVMRHRQILAVAQRSIATHQEYLSQIQTAFAGGRAPAGDVAQARERLAAVRTIVGDVRRALGIVEAQFINLVGRKPGRLRGVGYPEGIPHQLQTAIDRARANHPALAATQSDIDALERDRARVDSAFLPRVTLDGAATLAEDIDGVRGRNNDFSVRLGATWNLFNGGIDAARKDEQNERIVAEQIRLDRLRLDVDQAVREAWVTMGSIDQRIHALRNQIEAAGALIEAYREEYDAGLRDYLDLLNAEGNRFNAQIELASAETIALFARFETIAAMGALVRHFGVGTAYEAEQMAEPASAHGYAVGQGLVITPLTE